MGDAVRWMGPELINPSEFDPKERHLTKKSDCYALGMVIYEVLSGQAPFSPYDGTAILFKVVDGEHPARPQGGDGALFTAGLWRVLEFCWKPKPDDRPSLDIVLRCLRDGGKLPDQPQLGSSTESWFGKFLRNRRHSKATAVKVP